MKYILRIFLAAIIFSCPAALAQQQEATAPSASNQAAGITYAEPTFPNLSRLYWAIGRLDMGSNQDLDNYLMINECEIYLKYYHDDIEWAKIRDATRDSISYKMPEFPRSFEIIMPVGLGRYDIGLGTFPLEKDSARKDIKRLVVDYNKSNSDICGYTNYIKNYPKNLILLFAKPWSVTEFPASANVADRYLEMTQRAAQNPELDVQFRNYERIAYLRLKFTILQFNDMDPEKYMPNEYASVYANLDGYEIYADPKKKDLLYKKDLEYQYPKIRKASEPASVSAPAK